MAKFQKFTTASLRGLHPGDFKSCGAFRSKSLLDILVLCLVRSNGTVLKLAKIARQIQGKKMQLTVH